MHEFSVEHASRWAAWQSANAISARRSDRIARLFAIAMLLTASLTAVAAVVWR